MGKTRLKSRRRQDQGIKWARIAIAIISTIGVIDTGSITLSRWGLLGSLACPGNAEGCDKVLNSPWGTIFQGNGFSIPLSFIGLISYFSVLVLAILPFLPALVENKAELYRKTWVGLIGSSCVMTVFSLILIGLMVFKIKAFCFFCVLSASLSVSILILSFIGGSWDNYGQLIFRGILLSIGVLLSGLIWASSVDPSQSKIVASSEGVPPAVITRSTQAQISLAKHLTAIGAVQYSAYWCPHCHDQKELFGKEAADELVIVECAIDGKDNQRSLCQSKGITGFPSWEINGIIESGVKPLNELADLSRYNGSRDFK